MSTKVEVKEVRVPESKLTQFLNNFDNYLSIKETSEIPTYVLKLLLQALKYIAENCIIIIQDKKKTYKYYIFLVNFVFDKTLIYTVEDEFDVFTPEQIAKLLKMRYTVKTYDCLSNEDECLIKPIVYLIGEDDYSLYPLELKTIREIL